LPLTQCGGYAHRYGVNINGFSYYQALENSCGHPFLYANIFFLCHFFKELPYFSLPVVKDRIAMITFSL